MSNNKELTNTDCAVSFHTIKDMSKPAVLSSVIELLEEYAAEFGFQGWTTSNSERPKYKPLEKEYIINEIWKPDSFGDLPVVFFGGRKPYNFRLWLSVRAAAGQIERNNPNTPQGRYIISAIHASIDNNYFTEGKADQYRRVKTYLQFSEALYEISSPLFGSAHNSLDARAMSISLSRRGLYRLMGLFRSQERGFVEQPHIDCPIYGIYWANFLGSRCVAYYGCDRLANALGVVYSQKLKDGGMLLLTASSPLTPDNATDRTNQLALWDFFGLKPKLNLKVVAKYKSQNP